MAIGTSGWDRQAATLARTTRPRAQTGRARHDAEHPACVPVLLELAATLRTGIS
jgi:hypothetical protein